MSDFYVIDVETANSSYASICQIGAVQVVNGVIQDEWESLVNPEEEFNGNNIGIHGIRPDQVVNSPTWPLIHDELAGRFGASIVIGYGHFDRSAVEQATAKYQLTDLEARWLNGSLMVKRTWPDYFHSRGWGLANVARLLGLSFNHHNALEDARVATKVILEACRASSMDIEDWFRLLN